MFEQFYINFRIFGSMKNDLKMKNITLLIIFCGVINSTQAFLPLLSGSDTDCDAVCEDDPLSRPVCGTDGRTYDSECDVKRAKCEGRNVNFKHKGQCTEKARCKAQRESVLEKGHGKQGLFVPECQEDGTYAEVQCYHSTGYCWCVDEHGKPIRGSSVKNSRPNCNRNGRKSNRRRSNRGRRNRKACSSTDRASFNANLINIFESEFNRSPSTTEISTTSGPDSDPLTDTHEKAVVQWKFDQLDSNGDSYLKKREVRDLRRMAKKIVKPKACAKTFAKYCDLDQDKKISKSEWSVCVGVDINNEQVNTLDAILEDEPSEDSGSSNRLSMEHGLLEKHQRPHLRHDGVHSVLTADNEESNEGSKEEELQDCQTARQVALDSHHQDPAAGIYIPECTADGLYMRAQCHKSTQYCWCVHPRSGKPIKGTATQGIKPDCDAARKGAKSFKGCSLHKKQEFLEELVDSFVKDMIESAKNKSASIETPTPEKAARWKFSSMDMNSNSVLDKKEWKTFKKEWKSFQNKDGKQKRRLRRCWRNWPRFCDENSNQKITVDEWLVCTGITRDYKGGLQRNPKRRGPNPFSTILKSD